MPSQLLKDLERMRHVCLHLQGQPAGQDVSSPCLLCCLLFPVEQENLLSCFLNTKWAGPSRENIPSEYTQGCTEGTRNQSWSSVFPLQPAEGYPQSYGSLSLHPGRRESHRVREAQKWSCPSKVHWSPLRTPERQMGHCQIKDGIRKRHRHREALSRKPKVHTRTARSREQRESGYRVCTPHLQGQGMGDQGQKDQT